MTRRTKRKPESSLLDLILLVAIVWLYWSGHWLWGTGVLALFGWRANRGAPAAQSTGNPAALVKEALAHFPAQTLEDWQRYSRKMPGDAPERHLIYALRIASVVPSLTQIPTLASRWNTAHCGAGESGLDAAWAAPQRDEVARVLTTLFHNHLEQLLGKALNKNRTRLSKAKTPAAQHQAQAKAENEVLEWEVGFMNPTAEMVDLFAACRRAHANL